jgi:hypothetical protein
MQGCSPWSHGGRLLHVPEREPRIRRRRSSSCSRYRRHASSLLAVTHAIDVDNGVCQHCVTPLKLRAGGFVDPDLADGPATGALLSLIIAREKPATLPYRIGTIGQLFSINGSRTKATTRYCITPEPAQPYETAHLAASGKMMLAATASFVG